MAQMNDNDRAALVERLSKRINDVVKLSVRNNIYIAGVMAAEFDRLLAERHGETTVPDSMQPTVGRIVHYVAPGSADGRYPKAHRAAIITNIPHVPLFDPPKLPSVTLTVFNPEGVHFPQTVPYSADHEPFSWHWPEPGEGEEI